MKTEQSSEVGGPLANFGLKVSIETTEHFKARQARLTPKERSNKDRYQKEFVAAMSFAADLVNPSHAHMAARLENGFAKTGKKVSTDKKISSPLKKNSPVGP